MNRKPALTSENFPFAQSPRPIFPRPPNRREEDGPWSPPEGEWREEKFSSESNETSSAIVAR